MKFKLAVLIALACVAAADSALAQGDQFTYFNAMAQLGPDGELLPTDPNPAPSAMVHLIRTMDLVISAPAYDGVVVPEDTDGLNGDDTLIEYDWFGDGFTGPGFFAGGDSFAVYGITQASLLYVRVYDRPSSDLAGHIPVPQVYNDVDLLLLYPQALGTPGTFYFDGPVQLANEEDLTGGFYGYTIPTVGQGGWNFLAAPVVIPEPGNFVLACLGALGVFALRRNRR